MPAPMVLTFVSMVAFAIQLLIFAYLYSSHRLRFFQYLLLAWGACTLSKGLKLVDVLLVDAQHTSVATVGLMLAAAFAYRWDYRLGVRDLIIGGVLTLLLAVASGSGDEGPRFVGVGLGAVQMV